MDFDAGAAAAAEELLLQSEASEAAATAAAASGASMLEPMLSFLDPITTLSATYVGEKYKYIPFFIVLQVVWFVFCFALMHLVRVSRLRRAEFASCCVSFIHNLVSIFLAGPLLLGSWPFHFDDYGTTDQHIVLQYSVAYMVTDLACFLLPFTPTDYLFVGHHFATGLYMWDTIYLQRAAVTVMPWLIVGEATGPLLNVFTVAKTMRKGSQAWDRVFRATSPLFTVAFLLVRTVSMPVLLLWWLRGLAIDCDAVGNGHKIAWTVLVLTGALGSQVWSLKLMQGFFKSRKKKIAALAKMD